MKKESGFTLIEFIVMIVVASFLVGGIALYAQQLVTNIARLEDIVVANNLAKAKMALTNNTAYGNINNVASFADPDYPRFRFRRTITNLPATLGNRLRIVTILVDYTGGNFSNPLVTLSTYRQSNTTFGDGL